MTTAKATAIGNTPAVGLLVLAVIGAISLIRRAL
jgi:hypothetical protein